MYSIAVYRLDVVIALLFHFRIFFFFTLFSPDDPACFKIFFNRPSWPAKVVQINHLILTGVFTMVNFY